MVKHIIKIFFLLFYTASQAYAQSKPDFYLDVSPRAGSTDDDFILSLVIENAPNASTPYLIGGDDFDIVLLGPRSSTTITNGVVKTELAYNYRLIPKKEGLLESPSAEVEIGGRTFTAPGIRIKITKGRTPSAAGDFDGIILKQSVSSDSVFMGEQVMHTLSLYAAIPIYDYSFSDSPFEGFWNRSIAAAEKSITHINNKRYNLYTWKKVLFPIRSGELEIPSQVLTAKVQVKGTARTYPFGFSDPFNDPFGSIFGQRQVETRDFASNVLGLNVKALPTKPPDFHDWGASSILVGKSSLNLQYDGEEISSGESKTIIVELVSRGNLNAYSQLPLNSSPDYRIYQESAREEISLDAGFLTTKKTFRFSIVPLKPGEVILGPLKIGYFDPKTSTYKHASSEQIKFSVIGDDLRSSHSSQKLETAMPSAQLDGAKQEAQIAKQRFEWIESLSTSISLSLALFVFSLLAAALLIIKLLTAYLFAKFRKDKVIADIEKISNLQQASHTLTKLIAEKLGIKEEESYGEQFRALIEDKLHDQEIIYRTNRLLDQLHSMRFSREKPSSYDLQTIKDEIKSIVSAIP